jgi:hypothetical protein
MKHTAIAAVLLTLGVTGVYAQQQRPLQTTFSVTNVATRFFQYTSPV